MFTSLGNVDPEATYGLREGSVPVFPEAGSGCSPPWVMLIPRRHAGFTEQARQLLLSMDKKSGGAPKGAPPKDMSIP